MLARDERTCNYVCMCKYGWRLARARPRFFRVGAHMRIYTRLSARQSRVVNVEHFGNIVCICIRVRGERYKLCFEWSCLGCLCV